MLIQLIVDDGYICSIAIWAPRPHFTETEERIVANIKSIERFEYVFTENILGSTLDMLA